jgi:predicted RNA-binding protein (virulence factor B family)
MPIDKRRNTSPEKESAGLREGQKVTLIISSRTRAGFVAVINGDRKGLLYKNEIFQPLKIGQEIDGFIKKIRPDNKIDLSLYKSGYRSTDMLSRKILDALRKQGGFMAVTDKTRPQIIAELFGVSKKSFKQAIGNLYKKRRIILEKNGIRLQDGKKIDSGPKQRPRRKSGSARKSHNK